MQRNSLPSSSKFSNAQSVNRIMREWNQLIKNPQFNWHAAPKTENNLLEWHFTVKGPSDTDFEGGLYHGSIDLPPGYPLFPPTIMLLTPNGRFEVAKKICLSFSNFHPELWQPAWGVQTMLDALHSFFPTPGEGSIASVDWPADVRRSLAKKSVDWTCPVCKHSNKELIIKGCATSTNQSADLRLLDEVHELRKKEQSNSLYNKDIVDVAPPVLIEGATESSPNYNVHLINNPSTVIKLDESLEQTACPTAVYPPVYSLKSFILSIISSLVSRPTTVQRAALKIVDVFLLLFFVCTTYMLGQLIWLSFFEDFGS
eukprot:GHVL01044015.1.p1 GENE.GHVL01044015.1~~GHVL01044015.1.p1  ORF type:complete len:322 (+),score=34.72 GHVL01044015.1:27-968(+)